MDGPVMKILEKIVDELTELNLKVARQEVRLEDHMRRTELAEVNIEKIADTIKPIQAHVALIESGFRLTRVLGPIIGFMVGTGLAIWTLFLK